MGDGTSHFQHVTVMYMNPFALPPRLRRVLKREVSCLVFGRLFTGLKALKEIGFASDARWLLGPTGLKE